VTPLRSFRARMIAGSLIWTFGLLAVTLIIGALLVQRYPRMVWFVHNSALVVFATVLLVGGLSMLRRGLSPFNELRDRLAAVRDGRRRRVDGTYPTEVQPLVDDLNALLEHRERVVTRALAKAGDLAHGLKTPLAVLQHEANLAEAAGHHELATTIGQQVDRMRRQVDYHLAHARAAGSGAAPGARCSVSESAEGLARTLRRLQADRGVTIDVHVPPAHFVRVEREDLDEMLGNLFDNACRWGRATVTASSEALNGTIVTTVDDDGAGLDASKREIVLQRGIRADEIAPGSGLGLAIVRDLAELYGGTIALESAPSGGLRARLQLPACPEQTFTLASRLTNLHIRFLQ
jgi:signal transduction histidine kinase